MITKQHIQEFNTAAALASEFNFFKYKLWDPTVDLASDFVMVLNS